MRDLSDVFDIVDNIEDQIRNEGYEAGKLKAQEVSYKAGYTKGSKQARHLITELGFLRGIISSLLNNFSVETNDIENKVDTSDIRLKSKDCLILKKILTEINNTALWLERGKQSEQEVAQNLEKLHTKTRFCLKKYKIPFFIAGKEVSAEF